MAQQSTHDLAGAAPGAPTPRVAVGTNGTNVIPDGERKGAPCSSVVEDHERVIRIMGRYAPLVEIVSTDQVLAGR